MRDVDWMRAQARALYALGGDGRILHFNAPEGKQVECPVVFLGRTAEETVTAVRHDVLDAELLRLLAAEPPHAGESVPLQRDAIRDRVREIAPISVEWSGPAFRFPATLSEPTGVRTLGPHEAGMLEDAFPKLAGSAASRGPIVAAIENGRVLSACYAATGPGPMVEAGVDTVEVARGRGHAARVVAAWAARVRALGRTPLYSTSWENTASRAVARKLGLIAYGSDWHLRVEV